MGRVTSPVLPALSESLSNQLICHLKISVYVNRPRFHTGINPSVPSWYWSYSAFMLYALLLMRELKNVLLLLQMPASEEA